MIDIKTLKVGTRILKGASTWEISETTIDEFSPSMEYVKLDGQWKLSTNIVVREVLASKTFNLEDMVKSSGSPPTNINYGPIKCHHGFTKGQCYSDTCW